MNTSAGETQMHAEPVARRLFELIEPISMVNFMSPEPNDSMAALGFRNYWDGYFAGRSAPLGRVPAEVVHAAFYNFAEGEVARHIPKVWDTTTPEAAHAAREQGCVAALRRILGDLVETTGLARAADLPRLGQAVRLVIRAAGEDLRLHMAVAGELLEWAALGAVHRDLMEIHRAKTRKLRVLI